MVIKRVLALTLLFSIWLVGGVFADSLASQTLINATNFAKYFNDYLGYLYESHGCLHFTPSDIYLLVKTIPPGTPLFIKPYTLGKNRIPYNLKKLPYLADITNTPQDLSKHKRAFKIGKTKIVVYPAVGKLFIIIDEVPYAQVNTLAGPKEAMNMAFGVGRSGAVDWDKILVTPTDAGKYTILGGTSHYLSATYYKNTIVPFGSWIIKKKGRWLYQKKEKWYKLPAHVAADLKLPAAKRYYNYYDVTVNQKGKVTAARYAGHDFGKYALLWTKDGKNRYPELGYAAGELLFEQIMLVKDLAHILTLAGSDNFDELIARNANFSFYKSINAFIKSKGGKKPKDISPSLISYYKLFNEFTLTKEDKRYIDVKVAKAFRNYKENRLPRDQNKRRKQLGLYYFLKLNSEVFNKRAYWYQKLKNDWVFWKDLRVKLKKDFLKMGVYSKANRQNITEKWLTARLEFRKATLPKQAKNLRSLSFDLFFNAGETSSVFAKREREIMRKQIKAAAAGKESGLKFYAVNALNNYNFGVLLNDILGDLYKSHGCMHVSPRNAYFLFELLPLKTKITIYDYRQAIDPAVLDKVPSLANMVNFEDDLTALKAKFFNSEVEVVVYPSSGQWLIFLNQKPFARLAVKGGPKAKMYLVQTRDENGKPVFESHLAYPTTPGTYYVFKKEENYLSNIYYDTTVIKMGGLIKKENGVWLAENKKGKFVEAQPVIQDDLNQKSENWEYTYYDVVKNASGEVVKVRWGSHPFGRYVLQISRDLVSMHPELIHSSGDLMMEERQLITDLIKVLSAPHDDIEKTITYSQNFVLYKTCYDFVQDPSREDLIQAKERAYYRLYNGLQLTAAEVKILSPDAIAADKFVKNKELTRQDVEALIGAGVAYYRGGKLRVNMEKVLGLQFDAYQYVVMIQKYAHHYATLKKHWKELSDLRRALLKDFNRFVIKDPKIFHSYMRALMLKRTALQKLSNEDALNILKELFIKKKN